jgi:prolyl oligopeptidase
MRHFPLLRRTLGTVALVFATSFSPIAMSPAQAAPESAATDPWLWLEDVGGERALNWVREHNAATRQALEARPGFDALRTGIKAVLDAKDRLPSVARRGDWLYNFWQDADHPRGLWRRTSLAEFRRAQPAWDVVLDLDALARDEKENWVWKGANCLGGASTRCLLMLSRGGADATVVREFDLATRHLVPGGFMLPEAKTEVEWFDERHLIVGTDWGPGSLTDSGYARVIKLWTRGQPLASAVTIYEGHQTDVSAFASVDHTPGFERVMLGRSPDFYSNEMALWLPGAAGSAGRLQPIDKPADAQLAFWRERVLIQLRSDWTVGGITWPRGSLLVADAAAYLRGERRFTALFTPSPTRSLSGYTLTRRRVLLDILDNVAGRAEALTPGADGRWSARSIALPFPGTLGLQGLHDPQTKDDALGESFLATYTDFLTPDTLFLGHADSGQVEPLKAREPQFKAEGMRVEQRFATSKDGTRVPYFVVWPRGAKADGSNPTLLYGYGGFEVSLQPWYSGTFGQAWYEQGGMLVVANIRGGGEYGPAWHQAAVKAHRQRAYDDFIAVAEDLVQQRITGPRHLGIEGGSNGGLLVGAVMVQRPDLFNAVACQVPLLDMRRYHHLLAGASWMAEYGNPDDPAEWAFISAYSPYQNVRAGVKMPKVFFLTSTRDDRVHPGHARKMAARMMEQGHDVLYYENIEGGHAAGADNAQRADNNALTFAFLWQQLR